MSKKNYPAVLILSFIALALLVNGCSVKTPSRDHIPALKNKLYLLQEAVKVKNRYAIDSLLSVQSVGLGCNSDSLLNFVYGPGEDFQFAQFSKHEIAYTDDKARIDCYIMDSTAQSDRPVTFTLVFEHNMWLFKRFEEGTSLLDQPDSADTL